MAAKKDALMQCRAPSELRERAEIAAVESGLATVDEQGQVDGFGTWLRAIIQAAVEQHEADMAVLEAEDAAVPDPATNGEGYIDKVESDAREFRAAERPEAPARVVHPGLHEEPLPGAAPDGEAEPLSPRDCPHLPAWRNGNLCRCGTRISLRMVSGPGGFGGRRPVR